MTNPQDLQGFGEEIANYTMKDVSHVATMEARPQEDNKGNLQLSKVLKIISSVM